MKKFLKILLVCVLAFATILTCVACNKVAEPKKGLYLKKTGDYYTAYKYVDDGSTVLDISKYNAGEVIVGKIAEGTFAGNNTLVEVIVPDTVTEISQGAFKQMKKLEKITLPFVGKNANSDAFMYETGSSVDKAVDSERTFAYIFGTEEYTDSATIVSNFGSETDTTYYVSPYLSEVTIKNSNAYSIPMCAFKNVGLISKINLEGNIDAIGEYAFYNCHALLSINILETVEKIYKFAFAEDTNLESVDLSKVDTQIKLYDNAFECCESLANFDMTKVEVVGDDVFENTPYEAD